MRHNVLYVERMLWTLIITVSLTSCAGVAGGVSKVHPPTRDHTGAVRLAEVMQLKTRQEIVSLGPHYQHILASGIRDANLHDGSLAAGRVYCCGGPPETRNSIWFYVPNEVNVEVGNLVLVRMGRQPSKSDPGLVNTAVQVRHNEISQGPCRWVPEKEGLWMRILYCDWMEEEGWIKTEGIWETWLKPAPQIGAK